MASNARSVWNVPASETANAVRWGAVADAALRHMVRWVEDGVEPPRFPLIEQRDIARQKHDSHSAACNFFNDSVSTDLRPRDETICREPIERRATIRRYFGQEVVAPRNRQRGRRIGDSIMTWPTNA